MVNKYSFLLSLGLSFGLSILNGCKKDTTDFSKFDSYKPTPEFAIPLVNTQISMLNYVQEDTTNTKVDANGLVHFVYREDNLYKYDVADFFEFDNQNSTSINNKLGSILISEVRNTKLVTLQDLSAGFSPTAKAAFDAAAGTVNIFPAISENVSNITSFEAFTEFSSITFSEGYLIIKITNKLPVNLNTIKLNLYNLTPTQSLLGVFNYTNIAPGASKSDSIQLINKSLGNTLGYNLPVLNTNSSAPTAVLINYQDSIVINAIGRNLRAISGVAKFPDQDIPAKNTEIDFTPGDTTQRVRKLNLAAGKLKFVAQSTIKEPIQLTINFPGAKKNGSPFPSQIINIPYTGTGTNFIDSSIDISNVDFDLTQNPNKPYNFIPVNYTAKVISSGNAVAFDSSDYLNLQIETTRLQLEYFEGYAGTIEVPSDNNNFINLSFLDKIKNGLNLYDGELKLKVNNSIGIPIKFNYNFIGKNNDGVSQDAQLLPFEANYPSVSEVNQTKLTTQVYSNKNNNGKINELMSLPPHSIKVEGKAITNAVKDQSKNQFVKRGSKISVDVELDLPLAIRTTNFSLSDTSKFDINSLKQFTRFTLGLNTENGFPFETTLKLYFYNSKTNTIIDSLDDKTILLSAITDTDGKVIQTTKSRSEIGINEILLKKLKESGADKIITKSTLKTENSGSKTVKVFSDYFIKVSLGVTTSIKL